MVRYISSSQHKDRNNFLIQSVSIFLFIWGTKILMFRHFIKIHVFFIAFVFFFSSLGLF